MQHILVTHKHDDHISGALQLIEYIRKKYEIIPNVFAGAIERLDFTTYPIKKKESFYLGNLMVIARPSPCHTKGALMYYIDSGRHKAVFTGDTCFIGGCGMFFEGNGFDMSKNFEWLHSLPDETLVYDGHEYTMDNLKFGSGIDIGRQM